MAHRGYGQGSVYQRRSDGKWIGCVDIPTAPGEKRQRKVFAGKSREVVEARLSEWVAAHPPRIGGKTRPGHRSSHIQNARAQGTHTAAQWREKVASYDGKCHYCQRPLLLQVHKDHVIPVSRGGSDGIDNIVPACADCNIAKSAMTGQEFMSWAEQCGFFQLPRLAQAVMGGRVVRMDPDALRAIRAGGLGIKTGPFGMWR